MNVLFLTDHPAANTGVGTVTRSILKYGDLDYYVVPRQPASRLGSAPHIHGETYQSLGINGLRSVLSQVKPDALLLFGDAVQFQAVFEAEHEIRSQHCPIAWYHVWDAPPAPTWNLDLYKSCDAIFSISQVTQRLLGEQMGLEHAQYVPHGVDTERFRPLDENSYFEELEDKSVITYVGRNQHRKGLAEAMAQFARAQSEFSGDLVFALRTELRGAHNLPELADYLDISESVFFYPDMPGEMLNELYNRSDVVLDPAYREGFGLPTLEAGMAGCRRLSVAHGGLEEQAELKGHDVARSTPHYTGEPGTPLIQECRVSPESFRVNMMRAAGHDNRQEIAEAVRSNTGYHARTMTRDLESGLQNMSVQTPKRYYVTCDRT